MIALKKRILLLASVLVGVAGIAGANEIRVAVAANFTAPMKDIAAIYEKETGTKVLASFGATGAFYSQIKNGAPYQILFAADSKTPDKIVNEGLGVKESNKTYALGKLVLWSAQPNFVKDNKDFILSSEVKKLAVADPKLAPYGLAAYQTMTAWGELDKVKDELVTGDNIGKTFQFAKTGNAQAGFVALSQVFKDGKMTSGSGWIIPEKFYEPIKQNVVVLKQADKDKGVENFMKFFFTSSKVKSVIESYGYGQP